MRFQHFMLTLGALCLTSTAQAEQPNIILLLSDDQHWNETSVQMHPTVSSSKSNNYQTPNLEQMAKNGLRFSAAYAPAPVCAPTRASIQTGLSPAALGWCKVGRTVSAADNHKLIPPQTRRELENEKTIAQYLKKEGYGTAHFGKWHIGGGGPKNYGYDTSDGDIGNDASGKFNKPDNPVDIFGMTERAIHFMTAQKSKGKPFFIQMSYLALHSPGNASPESLKLFANDGNTKDRNIQRRAITYDLDRGVGQLLENLKKLNLEKNTYVIYMSDNGANGRSQRTISGMKGSILEGGTRAVFIAVGPNVPKNKFCNERIVGYDLFPTFCKLAGVKAPLPKELEGGDLSHLLHGKNSSVKRKHTGLLFHFPHYQGSTPMSAFYFGEYKLRREYETGRDKLFKISTDLAEKKDLAKSEPAVTKKLASMLTAHLKAVNAKLPVKNSSYDPSKASKTIQKGGGRGKGGGRKGKRK